MSHLLQIVFVLSITPTVVTAGMAANVSGKVLRIEESNVYLESSKGIRKIPLNSLSKDQKKKVNDALATKKVISLQLHPTALKKSE